jgi:hypothetical protein
MKYSQPQIEPTPTQKLRVYWLPQIPCKPFRVPVESVEQAVFLMRTLADYDRFQLEHWIKPDYSSLGGLEVWDEAEQDWLEWENDDCETAMDLMRRQAYGI